MGVENDVRCYSTFSKWHVFRWPKNAGRKENKNICKYTQSKLLTFFNSFILILPLGELQSVVSESLLERTVEKTVH